MCSAVVRIFGIQFSVRACHFPHQHNISATTMRVLLSVFCLISCISIAEGAFSASDALPKLMYSYAAYCPNNKVVNWTCYWCKQSVPQLKVLQLIKGGLLDSISGYAGVTSDESTVVFSFRGTQPYNVFNLLTDVNFSLTSPFNNSIPSARVHSGFLSGYMSVRQQVTDLGKKLSKMYPKAPIIVTGHSLGGALATLAAADLAISRSIPNPVQLWTFGSPRVGNAEFANYMSKSYLDKSYRVTFDRDPIVKLPPRLLGIQHMDTEYWMKDATNFVKCGPEGNNTNINDPSSNAKISDSKCSAGKLFSDMTDHLQYLGVNLLSGLLFVKPLVVLSGVVETLRFFSFTTGISASEDRKGAQSNKLKFAHGESQYRPRTKAMKRSLYTILFVILNLVLVSGRKVQEVQKSEHEYTATTSYHVRSCVTLSLWLTHNENFALVGGIVFALSCIVLYIIKTVTEETAVTGEQSSGNTSDDYAYNNPSATAVGAANPLLDSDRWRKFVSIPTIFVMAVLFLIAVIAVSITLLSYISQNNMVDDLTGQIQNSIGRSFLGQTNATLNDYAHWGREIRDLADNYIPPGTPPPNYNDSMYQSYPEIFHYLLASMMNRDLGSGFGIGFPTGKSFGGGNELFGADVFDTFLINNVSTVYVTILNASLSLDFPNPNPNANFIFPSSDAESDSCPKGTPTEFWAPLVPTAISATDVEISMYRYIKSCYRDKMTYKITVYIKFGRIATLLQEMVSQVKGRAFIVESDGALVASTTGTRPFALTDKGMVRYYGNNATEAYIREAWAAYQADPVVSQSTHTIDGVEYFLLPNVYQNGELSWIIIQLAESDPFLGTIKAYVRRSGIVIGVVCAVAVLMAIGASFWITRPFAHLTQQLILAARMQLTEEEVSVPFLFEARRLHQAFITMKEAMKSFQRYIPEALISTRMDYKNLKHLVEIGSGAFGVVFRAEWNSEIVAVKQVKTEHISESQMKDFLSEVGILQQLPPHPNVVLFKAATFPPQPLSLTNSHSMITEFCGGGSLYAYIRKFPNLSVKEKLRLLAEIARGMRHLHKQNVVHRDLALRNILLSSELEAKVSDFGLSRVNDTGGDGSTTSSAVGPLKWMSPEAITERKYSTKSDVFSFGVVVWELFEERDPFPGMTPVEAAFQVVNGQRLIFTNCQLPWLLRLVEACWDKDPAIRPSFRYIVQAMNNEGIPSGKELEEEIELVNIVVDRTNDEKAYDEACLSEDYT
ncbi:hypothetical protein PROFUN_04192 [Planoprotostelium fungivorum]|uniref:Protein kinase domain-containing protein n=1 Tax=Planoprotostelium fungivorum TaxID=1890364 RepID=A0A2P6NVV2_9EUKA|nr:hypothetical protein PROFUN_04192 [Planoprotostelium fungivorum]